MPRRNLWLGNEQANVRGDRLASSGGSPRMQGGEMAGRASDLLQSIGLKFDGSSPSGQCALIVMFGLLNPTDGELAIRAAVAKEVGPGDAR